METPNHQTVSRLPASRFPKPAEVYFCDHCGRDLTTNLHRDRAPVWQPLRPIWYVCPCGRKYLSGAAEWDDLSGWERSQRVHQLCIGVVLFALLVAPVTLAYFALTRGGTALLAVVAIALIPSILVAKPFWFVLLDVYEIIASVWRTRVRTRRALPVATTRQRMAWSRLRKLRLTPVGAAIAILIVATRWMPSHLGPASSVDAFSLPERSNAARQDLSAHPSLPILPAVRAAAPGAPSPAFRRVWVGPNEVDYVAEDVTMRHFRPTLPATRIEAAYKEVHIGADVTMRYFTHGPAVVPQTPTLPQDLSLTLAR